MPNTFSAVLVIVVFVIPGFIANRILSAAHSRSASSDGHTVLEAIALSSLNYAFLSWLLALAWLNHWYENPFLLVTIASCTLFVSPVVIALVFARLVDTKWGANFRLAFGMAHPVLKAWDSFFRTGKICWVVATLKGGRVIAGYYGPNSYASSFPAEEDLYLEKLCKLSASGAIEGVAEFSIGGIIQMKDVETLELFEAV